jgi:hypothetical protein
MKNLVALGALLFSLAKAGAAFDLQGLGSGQLLVEQDATTAAYSQTVDSLVFNNSYALGATLGGFFDAGAQDWSIFSTFGLRMTLTGTNPGMAFSLELYGTGPGGTFPVINQYSGNTTGVGSEPVIVPLTLSLPGTGILSSVVGMQFTWDSGDQVNTSIFDIVVAAGSFTARAPGGFRFITSEQSDLSPTSPPLGVFLAPGTTAWTALSDSNAKTDVTAIDHREVLREVAALPVTEWHYKHDPNRRYVGPMAQDFRAAFGLGFDETHISTLDTDGVTLSAVKGLIEELRERKERSAEQARRLAELEAELRALSKQIHSNLPPAK